VTKTVDVLVVGAGPAGWAIAARCARHALATVLVDPRPHGPWRATYGLWTDQCAALPDGADVVPAAALWAGQRRLSRGYAVLDNDSAIHAFRRTGVETVVDRVVSATADGTVRLGSGHSLRSRVVIDASGPRRVLSGGTPRTPRVEQTAFGVVVPSETAASVIAAGEAVFMRWDERDRDWPSFLYSVPLPGNRTLLEETSLARRPGLPLDQLEARLTERLGAVVDAAEAVERVRFAVDVPTARRRGVVVAFGVAAGMMHPATGYSVGDALVTAPAVAAAIAGELPRGGRAAARAAQAVVWSSGARVVRLLRMRGLRVLLALPPSRVPEFFDGFFALPDSAQRAYLSGREDVRGTIAAMVALFDAASPELRRAMRRGVLRG
jgi:lycopene beta-cyclase